jgi:hypothetical protein
MADRLNQPGEAVHFFFIGAPGAGIVNLPSLPLEIAGQD